MPYRKKLIEVALPLDAINAESAREKSIRHGHPSTLHLWWARRPLATCRAVLFASLVDDPAEPGAPPAYLSALDAPSKPEPRFTPHSPALSPAGAASCATRSSASKVSGIRRPVTDSTRSPWRRCWRAREDGCIRRLSRVRYPRLSRERMHLSRLYYRMITDGSLRRCTG